jgi:hypothetical protein
VVGVIAETATQQHQAEKSSEQSAYFEEVSNPQSTERKENLMEKMNLQTAPQPSPQGKHHPQQPTPQSAPMFTKRIGNTTYKINVHFSTTSKETMDKKIMRIIKNELGAVS